MKQIFGPVAEVNEATGQVRIRDAETGMLSWWLPVTQAGSGRHRVSAGLPGVGDSMAATLDDSLTRGTASPVYSEANPPPVDSGDKIHLTAADGAVIEYDAAAHSLVAHLPGGGRVDLVVGASKLTLTAGKVDMVNVDLTVSGTIRAPRIIQG